MAGTCESRRAPTRAPTSAHHALSRTRATVASQCLAALFGWILLVAAGCTQKKPVEPPPASPFPPGYSIAVAPALNFSGATELDPVRVADLFASELDSIDGLTILPVSRTVAVLAREGRRQVESPAHAVSVAERVGADAIIVLGITEYDPYTPIVVGLAAQLYERSTGDWSRDLQPVEWSREGRPFPISAYAADPLRPRIQVQRVYNAAHEAVADRIKKYASRRNADQSPYGWRRYMVSQELYLRFCCWEAANRMIEERWQNRAEMTASLEHAKDRP